jgi:hypothetical protein
MPIHSEITAISRSYPDLAVNSDKYFFEKKLFILVGIFYRMASRSHRICFVAAHSQWTTTASWADALHLRQPRLVNNPDQKELLFSLLAVISIDDFALIIII